MHTYRRRSFIAGLLLLASCGSPAPQWPTLAPVLQITPAPTQDVAGTATAYALAAMPTPTPPGLYIVREGDTLETIASAFNTTVEEIAATNRISDVNTIYVGQPLIIPVLTGGTNVLTPTISVESDQSRTQSP